MLEEFRQVGPGRYACLLMAPWGQEIPAEVIVTTSRGWFDRPEAGDERWLAYPVGPAIVAVRLRGGLPQMPAPGPPEFRKRAGAGRVADPDRDATLDVDYGRVASGCPARSRASWRSPAVGAC